MAITRKGAPQKQQATEKRTFFRTVQVVEIEEKGPTSKGSMYWRVKDDGNRYQTLWDEYMLEEIDKAQTTGEPLFWAIEQRPPSKPGMNTNYVIVAVGAQAKALESEDKAKGEQLPLPNGAPASALGSNAELTLRLMDMAVRLAIFEKKTGMTEIGSIARELKALFEVGIELDEPPKKDGSDAGMPASADDDIPF